MWDWSLDGETAGVTALVAADAAAFMSAFNPSIFTIRSFASDWGGDQQDETRGDIYRGIALGSALTLLTAIGGSAVTKSWWPTVAALFTLTVIALAYRWALDNPR